VVTVFTSSLSSQIVAANPAIRIRTGPEIAPATTQGFGGVQCARRRVALSGLAGTGFIPVVGGADFLFSAVPVLFRRSSVLGLGDLVGTRPYGLLVEYLPGFVVAGR
jgi:hypothetical protein